MGRANSNKTEIISSHEAFRQRMLEQCHRIWQYRLTVMRDEGRMLTPDEAGMEWIELYAEDFSKDRDGN